ncbi:Choline-sulfatase [bacterium HR40]|nr:Choline-sulfatase [bacterium HR40]
MKRPDILLVVADQLSALALRAYGHPVSRSPHLDRLAADGVVFDHAYCNFPLCAPARAALMSGQLATRVGVYDNAAEFRAEIPTFAHALRNLGYRTALAGKMHFVGPDQLHGFEERLTTDIYPADFGWTPDWDHPQERIDWWYHNMDSVLQAGVAEATNQLDFDEEVGFVANRWLADRARERDRRPFLFCVSFTHPHDPFAIPRRFWDLYEGIAIDPPRVPPIPLAEMDAHSRRLYFANAMDRAAIGAFHVERARRAYYGAISYIDEQLGRLLSTLATFGLDDTIVIFTADHGEMLGERGMWYKMHFFEPAVRVPLLVHAPNRFPPARVREPVSHLDLFPTLVELAGGTPPRGLDGRSLLPALGGEPLAPRPVLAEYTAEGAIAPILMIRDDRYKFIWSPADPPLLFDLAADPLELVDLATEPSSAARVEEWLAEIRRHWQPESLHRAVLESQRRRRFVFSALRQGTWRAWDFQPFTDASRQYMRNHLDLNELEAGRRFPPATRSSGDGAAVD